MDSRKHTNPRYDRLRLDGLWVSPMGRSKEATQIREETAHIRADLLEIKKNVNSIDQRLNLLMGRKL